MSAAQPPIPVEILEHKDYIFDECSDETYQNYLDWRRDIYPVEYPKLLEMIATNPDKFTVEPMELQRIMWRDQGLRRHLADGNLEAIAYVAMYSGITSTADILETEAYARLEVLQWLCQEGVDPEVLRAAMLRACRVSDVEAIKWLRAREVPWPEGVLAAALKADDIRQVKALHAAGYRFADGDAAEACRAGCLNAVVFILDVK